MNATQLAKYKGMLLDLRRDLASQNDLGRDAQGTVMLDQQSVGRLSRMDALQQQAMAKAHQGRRDLFERRIALALQRLDEGEFGFCTDCGDEIGEKRLNLDPTIPNCVSCAAGR